MDGEVYVTPIDTVPHADIPHDEFISCYGNDQVPLNGRANAHLIAAAPELHSIGEQMARALERLDSGHPLIAEWCAVDAKAKGEQV